MDFEYQVCLILVVTQAVIGVLGRAANLGSTKKGSANADLLGYLVISGVCATYMGVFGAWGWFVHAPKIDGNRLYGYSVRRQSTTLSHDS